MNYVFSRLALGFFGAETLNTDYKPGGYTLVEFDARDLAAGIHHMYSIYSWEVAAGAAQPDGQPRHRAHALDG
jgi:hypothetical protein